jgi:hypothetical protein
MLRLWCGSASRSDVRPKSCFGGGHGRSNVQVDFPRARGADRVDSGQRFEPGGRFQDGRRRVSWRRFRRRVPRRRLWRVAWRRPRRLARRLRLGRAGLGLRWLGLLRLGYAGWGYPWWGWGYPYGYGDDYGSGWGPDYAGYGYGYPPPTVEAALAGSMAKSGRSQADEAATSGGGWSTSAIGRLSAGRQLRILSFLRLGKAVEHRSD